MRMLPVFLLAAFLLPAPLSSRAGEEDPAALVRPLWGLTAPAIEERLGARVEALASRLDFGPYYAERRLRDVTVAGVPFTAWLQMDRETGRLAQVLLERRRMDASPRVVGPVVDALVARHGPPDEERAGKRPGIPMSVELSWRLPDARLVLHLFDFRTSAIFSEDPNLDRDPLEPFYRRMRNNPRFLPARLTIRISPAGAEGP